MMAQTNVSDLNELVMILGAVVVAMIIANALGLRGFVNERIGE